jgi:hypothetical protein
MRLKNESHGQQGEWKSRVLFKQRGKAKFYLSRGKKSKIYMGGLSERLRHCGSFYKDFIVLVEGKLVVSLCYWFIVGRMSSPANVVHGNTMRAPFSLSNGP